MSGSTRDRPGRHRGPEDRRTVPVVLIVAAVVVALAVIVVGGAVIASARPPAARTQDCPQGTTRLVVLSSPDKAAMLRRLGAEFGRSGRDASGRCVDVRVVAKDSAAATALLSQGGRAGGAPAPDVWSPSASLWLAQLQQRLVDAHRPSLTAATTAPSIATSPLVVAMPRPMATALGWPRTSLGWSDLLRLAGSRAGWGEYGHLEWGRFTLGATDPRTSQSGLEATLAAYAAATGRSADLSLADVRGTKARTFVAGVQQSVARYSSSDAEYLADVRLADDQGRAMTSVSALVTREELVVDYDRGEVGRTVRRPPRVPLVAIHPREGVPVADHPYAVLQAPWVGPRERAAAAAFLDWLRGPDAQRRWRDAGFRDARGLAAGGRADIGIRPAERVRTMTPPSPQVVTEILRSWSQLKKPADVLNLVDVSGSMDQPSGTAGTSKLRAASDAARSAMRLFTDDDEVGLWTFSTGSAGRPDWQQVVPIGAMRERIGGATRRATLDADLQRLRTTGGTALYDSLAAAYDEVRGRYRADRINAVVVLTDGRNSKRSGRSLDALLDLLASAPDRPVRIVTIAYGRDVDHDVLNRIAAATGGAAYTAPTTDDIPTAYASALSNF